MFLRGGFTATGAGSVTIDMRATRIGGYLGFAPARLENTAGGDRRLDVDGLTYAGLPLDISPRWRLQLLPEATPQYAAQP